MGCFNDWKKRLKGEEQAGLGELVEIGAVEGQRRWELELSLPHGVALRMR